MATSSQNTYVNLTPYDEQLAELQRRQKMAEMLSQQANAPLETPQNPGRMISKISPVSGLAKMLQSYLAGSQLREIDKERGAAEEQGRTSAMNWLDKFSQGKAAPMSPDQALQASLSTEPTEPQRVPFTPTERNTELMRGAMNPNPYTSKLASVLMAQKPERMLKLGDVNPDDFTAESLRAAMAADDPGLLVAKPEKPVPPTVVDGQMWNPKTGKFEPAPGLSTPPPKTVDGGMQWNSTTGKYEPIVGWAEQQGKAAAARRPPIDPAAVDAATDQLLLGINPTGVGRNPAFMQAVYANLETRGKATGVPYTNIADARRKLGVQTQVEKSFTSGQDAKTIQSLNTFTQHSNHLYEMASALDRGDVATFNKIATAYQAETNQPVSNDLHLVGQLVADELQKAALGTTGGVAEREELVKRLTGSGVNGKVIMSAIQQARGLVKGQFGSLKQKWKAGYFDPESFDQRFLTQDTQDLFKQPESKSNSVPIDKLKEGIPTTFRNGQVWTLQNGKPVRVQ